MSEAFAHLAGDDAHIDVLELQSALGLKSEYLAARMLSLFDRDKNGYVCRGEFLDRVRGLVFGTDRQKLRFVFRLHDHNEDGLITRPELHRMISLSLAEDQVAVNWDAVDRMSAALFLEADANRDGSINFEEFETLVRNHPTVLNQITRSESRWIAPSEDLLHRLDNIELGFVRRMAARLENRGLFVFWAVLWAIANIVIYLNAVHTYYDKGANIFVMLARGGGACLNFNGMLILLPMMRRLWTWVRKTPINRIMPVDETIDIHRFIGHAMFGFAVVHTIAHFLNYALGTSAPFVNQLFMTKAGLTGFILLIVFSIMWVCSLERIRRSGKFELFYFTHLLYVAWFALCLIHGPVFWMWAGVPIAMYIVERIVRLVRRGQATEIVAGHALRSGVTRLEIKRPANYRHRAGDYLFIRIPDLAPHEWHPFTISSAPEKENITVHVRSLGNWTGALREFVQRKHAAGDHRPLRCFLDGPYGTPTNHIFESKHAILVGAGIGVTPFAAILESIWMRAYGRGDNTMRLEKVHFVWLNRDQYSFEWFAALLAQLELDDTDQLIDIHAFMTDGRTDITAGALSLARDIMHKKGYRDLVTGLRAQTHFGRPDFNALLRGIVQQHAPEPVDLFFCGPPGLARLLRGLCVKQGIRFRQEHF